MTSIHATFFAVLVCAALALPTRAAAEGSDTPWRFVVLPDLHNAEGYVVRKTRKVGWDGARPADLHVPTPEEREALVEEQAALYRLIRDRLGDGPVVVPGDVANGEWHDDVFAAVFRPDLGRAARVEAAGDLVYGAMREAMRRGGLGPVLAVPGDHEYGDNPWRRFSPKDLALPAFRAVFARHFHAPLRNAEASGIRFVSAPEGTPFAETSFAVRHRDALFVGIDQFLPATGAIGRDLVDLLPSIGERAVAKAATWVAEGEAITGDVAGAHLDWLENVLRGARDDPAIEHVFVFGHLPVLHPVRTFRSSGMLLDGDADSAFWRLLRRYEVDAYFAGEVHADTLIEDDAGTPLQVTTKAGSARAMALGVEVSAERLVLTQFARPNGGALVETGRYVLDRRTGRGTGSGHLAPVDRDRPFLHYRFDTLEAGTLINDGTFGRDYDLGCETCTLTQGVEDSALALADGSTGATIGGRRPSSLFQRGRQTTIALQLRAEAQAGGTILSIAGTTFAVLLEDGGIDVVYDGGRIAARPAERLDDGRWHEIVLTHERDGRLSGIRLAVDGEAAAVTLVGDEDPVVRPHGGLSVGADAVLTRERPPFPPLRHAAIDNLRVWPHAIDPTQPGSTALDIHAR